MNFKRLVSGVCAFAIAVTQTAIVPISVSATEYTYKPVPNFSNQFKVGSSIFSTSPNADNSEETNYHWNGPANDVETSAKQLVLDGSTIDKANTPDGATVVNFSFSTVIDDEYYKVGDEFDFTVSGFTATLTKNVEEAVEEKTKTISNGGALSTDSPITVDAYADAIDGSRITVTYTVDSADDAALDIVNANDASLSGGAVFDASATTFEATLNETTAKTVAENGFKLSGNGITVTDVSITVPAHTASVPKTETFVNNEERSWKQVCKGTWFDGSLTFAPETITINDFKDFVDNCSMTFEWSDITCTASRRISFSSVNSELWSGDEDLSGWSNWVSLPPFDYAEKFSRLTVEYTPVGSADSSDEWSPAIKFVDMAGANGWENIPALHENGNEEGVITLDKDSTEITITLTKTAADALKNGALGFGGQDVRITKVTSLEAVPVTTVVPDETSFPNATFREFVSDACDLDKDGELVPAELAMIKDINFNKPNEDNPDENQKYTDEKYQKIDDFTGIEYLTELTYIGIRENAAVRTLDVSACTKLDCIDAGNCENLETVTVPDSIKALYIYNSSVKSVDVSKCTSLEILFAFNAKLTSLDVSKNTSLKELNISDNNIAFIDLKGLNDLGTFEADHNSYAISLTEDNKFDLSTLLDVSKFTLDDGQDVTLKDGVLTVDDGVSEITYTYDTGLDGKTFNGTFKVAAKNFDSVNATLWKGNKKFPYSWGVRIMLPAFSYAEKGTRLTVEYTVTPATEEEIKNDPENTDGEWWPIIGFKNDTDGAWTSLTGLHPDQDDTWGNITVDKASTSVTVTLTEEAAAALRNGMMGIEGANITVTAVKSLEADPDAPKDVEINPANFPNDTFREIAKSYDTNNDDVLTYIERSKLRGLDLSKPDENNSDADQTYADDKYRQIDNFKGIEYFTNLEFVNISGNTAVTSIDLSNSTKLHDFNGANCSKLEKVVLPEGVKEVYIYISGLKEFDAAKYPKLEILKIFNTQVTGVDVSKNPNLKELDLGNDKLTSDVDISNCPELIELSVNSTGIKKLDVSKNKKLEILDIGGNKGIELIGIEDLTTLKELTAWTCGLKKLDVSKSKGLEKLHINDNSIVAIDLSGFESLTAFESDYQGRDIELINNTFNLADLSAYGLDPGKVTLEEPCGATRDGNVLTFPENVDSIRYTYDTGKEDMVLTVTLNVVKRTESNFTVSHVENDKTVTVTADEWADVLKVMNNKNIDYVVYLNNDVEVKKLTFPTAAKAKSIAVYSPRGKTITTDATSVTLPINTTFNNISIESTAAKNFTITASKNLDISDFCSEKLKTLKGGAKSVLTFNEGAHNTVKADISGFGTIAFDKCTEAELLGTVKATTLKLNDSATVIVKNNSVTFTNIEIAGEEAIMTSICYGDDNFKPITVTGNITAENNASKIRIYKRVEKHIVSFSAEQTVLTAKTASLANVEVFEGSMPKGEINYTLARVGSDIKLLAEKLKVVTLYDEGGMNETVYAQWSDVLSTIAANAKAGQKDNEYHVTLLDDYNMNGVFKMPAAKTYSSLNFSSEQSVKTITFTGNITLTGFTIFNNIKLDAQKKSGKEFKPTDFTIAAGKNSLQLEYVNANIKSITSSGEVQLTGTTVGAVTANSVVVWANSESEMLGYAAMGAAWDGKTAPTTTVNIKGNLTVKKLLELENNSSLSVGGIINAGEIFALEDTVLVVKQQAKGKNALVIGKSGFDNNSGKINFVLVDPKTEKTAEITEDLILGTIAGPYADQLVPSNDNLTEADSYYIIKSGKNLIAKPKKTAGLVTVEVNGKKAYYKSLNEAIADINTSGSKNDDVVIYLTQDMFPKAVAKLPLPSANKYNTLTYKSADENSEEPLEINITGDLALTGDLVLDKSIALNKVDKTGKVTALGVNVGKYTLTAKGTVSETTTDDSIISNFANISGAGKLCFSDTAVNVAGKVNGTTLIFDGSVVTLVGTKAGFTGSIEAGDDSELIYDKSIAKNVKFTNVTGQLELVVKDGEKTVEFEENAIVASITGNYTKDAVIVNGSDLKIVRSGNNLKAVKEENVLLVEASVSEGITTERTYDSLASAINDISRIKDTSFKYKVTVTKDDTFVLPKAKTYGGLTYVGESAGTEPVKLTTTKDITLTGSLSLENITLNKVDRNGNPVAMSVNLGTYTLNADEGSHISYDGKVSQFTNINGKGSVQINDPMTVSGKINVNIFHVADDVTLTGKSSGFTAVYAFNDGGTLCYPVSIGKNVVLTNIIGGINAKIDGVKAGDQIATLKGDYFTDTVVISNDSTLAAVRSGNKLVAVEKSSMNFVEVEDYSGTNTRAYDSIASAITDITRLNNAKVEYTIYLNSGDYVMPKLTLPAKGKCAAIRFSATTSSPVNITVSSDITLTCNLTLRGKIILKKAATKTNQPPKLKFTSPKNKDGTPTYKVDVDVDATIINGTLNGEPINPTPTTP